MKLGVCVPYRNREMHLNEFIPKVGKYLKSQNIDFQMYFCHQVDDKLFNRGATKNIAAKHAFEDGCTHIVWHDIDMIPEEEGGAAEKRIEIVDGGRKSLGEILERACETGETE